MLDLVRPHVWHAEAGTCDMEPVKDVVVALREAPQVRMVVRAPNELLCVAEETIASSAFSEVQLRKRFWDLPSATEV